MSEMTTEIEKKEETMPVGPKQGSTRGTFIPRTDILSAVDEITLLADMPGVDEHSLDITLDKNLLTIHGQVANQDLEGYKPVYSEYRVGDYERAFTLSDEIDRDKIEALLVNGVLQLKLIKSESAKARKIKVRAEM
jgi:HSP20 family protein